MGLTPAGMVLIRWAILFGGTPWPRRRAGFPVSNAAGSLRGRADFGPGGQLSTASASEYRGRTNQECHRPGYHFLIIRITRQPSI